MRLANHEQPESLVPRLAARLSRHRFWDALLIFLPPVFALTVAVTMLFRASWLSPVAAILVTVGILVLALLAVWLRLRVASIPDTARLVDRKSGAKDHFLTLATVDIADQPPTFLARLRRQASSYVERIEFRRDFPYRVKRSAYWSTTGSLIAILLLYFLFPVAQSALYPLTPSQRLREVARELAKKTEFKTLAKELETFAMKLDDPKTSAEEKRALAQKLEQKIAEQQKKEEQKENQNLLGQASNALNGTEQQQAASGQEQKKDQEKGGGGLQTNAQQEGQGESKQSQGGSGESKGDSTAQLSRDIDQGKSAQGNPKEPGQDKNRQGDGKNNQPDPNPSGKDSQQKVGQTQSGSKEGAGKEQVPTEAPPQAGPPVDRFYQPGEGKDGLKGAHYVTVQLPEDIVADAKGETRASKESKSNRSKSQIPVSNVPLPAHVPNAPTEKQMLPLEYRGVIR
ncbi:MAG: hypothetical protein ACM3SP_09380 [Chloroflexota bacterium]